MKQFILWSFFLLSTQLTAQDSILINNEQDISDLKLDLTEIVIYAPEIDRSPFIDFYDLKNKRLDQIDNILTNSTSVFVKDYGPNDLSTISYRGTSANHSNVLWNGIRLQSLTLGTMDIGLLNMNGLSSMSVEDAADNGGANYIPIGGSLNMNQKTWNKSEVQLYTKVNTYGSYSTNAILSLGDWKRSSLTSVTANFGSNNFKYKNIALKDKPIERRTFSDLLLFDLKQSLDFKHRNNYSSQFNYWGSISDREIAPVLLTVNQFATQKDQHHRFHYSLNKLLKAHTEKELSLSFSAAHIVEQIDYNNEIADIHSLTQTHRTIGSLSLGNNKAKNRDYYKKKPFWEVKAAYEHQIATKSSFDFIPKKNWLNLLGSIYWNPTKDKNIIYFAKIDAQQSFNSFVAPSIVIGLEKPEIYTNTPEWRKLRLGFSLGRSVNFPTFNDLYWPRVGNSDLQEEVAYSSQFNIIKENFLTKSNKFTLKTHLDIFGKYVKNWILWTPNNNTTWSPDNLKNVLSTGIEIKNEFTYTPSYNSSFRYSLLLNYVYTSTKDYSDKSAQDYKKQLIYIPLHYLTSEFRIQYKLDNYLIVTQKFSGKRYTTRDNSEFQPKYNTTDIGINKLFRFHTKKNKYNYRYKLHTSLSMLNIFNFDYQVLPLRPMPRRGIEIKIIFKYE